MCTAYLPGSSNHENTAWWVLVFCSGRLGATRQRQGTRSVGLKDVYGSTNRKCVMQYRTSFEWCSSREHIAHNCSRANADYSFCALAKFFDRNVRWECRFKYKVSQYPKLVLCECSYSATKSLCCDIQSHVTLYLKSHYIWCPWVHYSWSANWWHCKSEIAAVSYTRRDCKEHATQHVTCVQSTLVNPALSNPTPLLTGMAWGQEKSFLCRLLVRKLDLVIPHPCISNRKWLLKKVLD